MHFDALTLAAVADELRETVAGGRVQQIVLPDSRSVALEIYAHRQRLYLLLSAHPQASRVHLVEQKLRRGVPKETPLLLLLRKYVRGARLEAVELPVPFERVLFLRFHHPRHAISTLAIEPIGRLGNLILMNDSGQILDALVRVPPGENAQRVLLPRRTYQLPPRPDRSPPLCLLSQPTEPAGTQREIPPTKTAAQKAERQDLQGPIGNSHMTAGGDDGAQGEVDKTLWRSLLKRFAGVSPTLAREAVWRATGNASAPVTSQEFVDAHNALRGLWSLAATGDWIPGIAVDENNDIVAFAPYDLHFCGEFEQTDSISAAVAAFYAMQERDVSSSQDEYAGMRGGVAALIRQAQARAQGQLRALAADEPEPGEPERMRTQAEWLLALSSQIVKGSSQPGATEVFSLKDGWVEATRAEDGRMELIVPSQAEEGDLVIPLDPKRSPVEQAERMFDRAAKLERAARFIPQRRAKLEADQVYLQQLETDLSLAQNQPEIAAVRAALREAGFLRQRPNRRDKVLNAPPLERDAQPDRSQPLRFLAPEGFPILVGRNARQNEIVTFTEAGSDDLWLHVRDAPGAHVVIRCGGQPVRTATRATAAQLAAYYSQQRGNRRVAVAVTRRRFVTRMVGGRPGQAHFRNEETINVAAVLPPHLVPA